MFEQMRFLFMAVALGLCHPLFAAQDEDCFKGIISIVNQISQNHPPSEKVLAQTASFYEGKVKNPAKKAFMLLLKEELAPFDVQFEQEIFSTVNDSVLLRPFLFMKISMINSADILLWPGWAMDKLNSKPSISSCPWNFLKRHFIICCFFTKASTSFSTNLLKKHWPKEEKIFTGEI